MTPDEQEALSLRYSFRSVLCLALSSGRIAIFDRAFRLKAIVDNPMEVIDIIKASMYNAEPVEPQAPKRKPTLTLEDLGL